jgi:hypothetical protein
MLLLVLSVVLLIAGILATCLYVNSYYGFWARDVWMVIGAAAVVFGLIGSLSLGVTCLKVSLTKDVDYQVALNERTSLVYRLENQESNLVGNEMLYSEITEFNSKLLTTKKWADNPWIGCCFNDLIADLDYIDYQREG